MNEMIDFDYQKELIEHYASVWGHAYNFFLWDKGPYQKLPFNFRVLEFAPTFKREMWTYATCCMSQEYDDEPIELFVFSSHKSDEVIELLTAVAYYHRNTKKLNLNHMVNFGRPWQNKSLCEYGFISLPYLDGPDLENLLIPSIKKLVKFYWLIPITKSEKEYSVKFGVEALESKFDEDFDYLDSNRESLV